MILGVDGGSRTVPEAERLLHAVAEALGLPDDVVACTHFVRTGLPHVACSVAVPGPVDLGALPEGVSAALGDSRTGPEAEGAARAAAEHAGRLSGRVVLFPGRDALVGSLTVGDLLECSAVERVLVLAQPDPPDAAAVVNTRDHVRPVWRDGLMTLLTMPAAGGLLMPAEVPDPTPCCADHA
ncbi:hypothetical protein [Microbispora sp. ATCC PTA-5024]|uniref:hypothetical protein n=1 Tax=Microbispora sp. ATCC PTA-5024 TaxID=316330 RepID=UPI0003DDECB1|nr:hypothetical protein [Microbispora sp. ATCC PTA-5024]ETK35190.1 hypothetical protein MPTA5024_15460 [Microbispora sp. ATCC PTA-5024]